MIKEIKSRVIKLISFIGFYKPVRKLYNLLTLFNSKMIVKVCGRDAIFLTPTYRIREDLQTLFGEKELLELFLNEIEESDVVWDVGASYGIYTIFSALNACKGKVYAFEPESSTHKMLMKNIKLNKLPNIIALQIALTEKTGEGLLYTSNSANIGTHSMFKRTDYPVSKKGKLIKTCSGDELVEKNKVEFPDIIKIDVEGSELNVLRGMVKILGVKKVRVLQVEVHPRILALLNLEEKMVLNLIESFDFRIVKRKVRGSEVELFCRKG